MSAAARPRSKPLLVLVSAILLPVLVTAAVLVFAWPSSRIAPRGVPLGMVVSGQAGDRAALALEQAEPGAFDLTLYATDAAARQAIENHSVYGALEPTAGNLSGAPGGPGGLPSQPTASEGKLTVLTASAASPTVAQLITQVGETLAQQSTAHGTPMTFAASDVVPSSSKDPRGLVLSTSLLPLTICSVIFAAALALLVGLKPAWRQVIGLAVVSALGALGSYLIAQGYLGALPGQHLETWASLALMMFAMSSTVAGFIAWIGPPGLGLGATLLVFLGNPFSGLTSAPELLPSPAGAIGQLLPPGAGASLLRETAYFGGHGPGVHLVVLICWALFGILAIFTGHHGFVGYAARFNRAEHRAALPTPRHETAYTS